MVMRVAPPQPEQKGTIVPSVLVVDDDPKWSASPSKFVSSARVSRSPLRMAVTPGCGQLIVRFRRMLIDVFMPHMRGFESIRMFPRGRPDVPIIAMSGYAFANTERARISSPMDHRTRSDKLPAQAVHTECAVDHRHECLNKTTKVRAHLEKLK